MNIFLIIFTIIFLILILYRKKKVRFQNCETDTDCTQDTKSVCGKQHVCENII
jgi:hypothetical protein